MDKTCTNCAYYHPTDKDRLAGECRHSPPHVMTPGVKAAYWPKVDGLDWCGQFMSRENLYEKKKRPAEEQVIDGLVNKVTLERMAKKK